MASFTNLIFLLFPRSISIRRLRVLEIEGSGHPIEQLFNNFYSDLPWHLNDLKVVCTGGSTCMDFDLNVVDTRGSTSMGFTTHVLPKAGQTECSRKRKSPPNSGLPRQLPGHEIGNLPIFSYKALRQTTNCFHEENELGVGGFGSVYLSKTLGCALLRKGRIFVLDETTISTDNTTNAILQTIIRKEVS